MGELEHTAALDPGAQEQVKDPVDTMPPFWKALLLAIQHNLIAYGGLITTPVVVGIALNLKPDQLASLIAANICVAGAATILQTIGVWRLGSRLPIVMGATFTAIGPAIVLGKQYGLPAVYGATMVSGLIATGATPFFGRILKYFPPIVTGSVIAIIGISLLPESADLIQGEKGTPGYNSMSSFLLALITVLIVLALDRFGKGMLRQLGILVALIAGTLIAIPMGKANFADVGQTSLVLVPHPFAFGAPTFVLGAIFPMLIVQFVSMVETTGDVLAIGEIVERPDTGVREVTDALYADGASTAVGAVFTPFALVSFANNVGLVQITKVFSRHVVAIAGGIFIVLGLFGPFGAAAASLPKPVLGGITVVMFGTIGGIGIKILAKADLNNSRNIYIIALSFAFGFIPVGAPHFWDGFPSILQPVLSTGIAAGGIAAFVLNMVLNVWGADKDDDVDRAEGDGDEPTNAGAQEEAAGEVDTPALGETASPTESASEPEPVASNAHPRETKRRIGAEPQPD